VAFQPHDAGPIDPELTASFLSSQENVLSARAWTRGESVLARVTVTQDARITETDLLNACLDQIGARHTPKAIWLDRRARPAA
jgi:hypothetical protein